MVNNRRVVVVLPAFNAERTLQKTIRDVPPGIVDEFIIVDDASHDGTVAVATAMGIPCIVHPRNRGYGGNQKTCYREALNRGADIIVMLHPDYQYSPRLLGSLVWLVASGEFDLVLGSRILGKGALVGGMPVYKYIANRILTAIQNVLIGAKLSEYHTGYRAYSREALEAIPFEVNSDDFVFDNQLLVQAHFAGLRIGEVSCPTRYAADASSITFRRAVTYGFGVLGVSMAGLLHRCGLRRNRFLQGVKAVSAPGISRRSTLES